MKKYVKGERLKWINAVRIEYCNIALVLYINADTPALTDDRFFILLVWLMLID